MNIENNTNKTQKVQETKSKYNLLTTISINHMHTGRYPNLYIYTTKKKMKANKKKYNNRSSTINL